MNTYLLKVSTPDGNIFKDEIAALVLRGADGDLAILAGHAPIITTVKSGECRIEYEDGRTVLCHTDGGILKVSGEEVVRMSASFSLDK